MEANERSIGQAAHENAEEGNSNYSINDSHPGEGKGSGNSSSQELMEEVNNSNINNMSNDTIIPSMESTAMLYATLSPKNEYEFNKSAQSNNKKNQESLQMESKAIFLQMFKPGEYPFNQFISMIGRLTDMAKFSTWLISLKEVSANFQLEHICDSNPHLTIHPYDDRQVKMLLKSLLVGTPFESYVANDKTAHTIIQDLKTILLNHGLFDKN